MELIQSIVVDSTQPASVSFSSIPQDATDLLITLSVRQTTGNWTNTFLRFNDVDSGYATKELYGNGATATTRVGAFSNWMDLGFTQGSEQTANTYTNTSVLIPNYRSSNAKTVLTEYTAEVNAGTAFVGTIAGTWSGTTSINKVSIFSEGGTRFLQQNSTISLYKITAGSDGITTVS